MKLWTTLVAIIAGGLPAVAALAQAPTPAANAVAPAAGAPPVLGPSAADPALPAGPAPTAQPPAPAPAPAQPPAADAWSAAIDKGRTQETTEYADVREKKEARESRAAFEAITQPLRQRLRFFVAASVGVQYYTNLYFETPAQGNDYTVRSVMLSKPLGAAVEVGGGVRGSIAEHFDLQTRLGVTFSRLSAAMDLDIARNSTTNGTYYGYVELETTATLVGGRLDGTVRWLPQLMGPRFFVGLGPLLELSSVSASSPRFSTGDGTSSVPSSVDVNDMFGSAYGLLELGVIFGSQEDWEAGLRGLIGVTIADHSKDAEYLGGTLARAF